MIHDMTWDKETRTKRFAVQSSFHHSHHLGIVFSYHQRNSGLLWLKTGAETPGTAVAGTGINLNSQDVRDLITILEYGLKLMEENK